MDPLSWSTLPPEVRKIAEEVCSPGQLAALKLWGAGAGYARIGLMLGISKSTAQDRVKRARQKIAERAEEQGVAL